ncbi:N-methyl-L-tryptophan oxidase [Pseudonocardia acaciae]|uniref:N-methyl-L-tryptophan oxidase n=1 Tax=Pseudonocardia acaciae TaxID=551276 RepID=UPI000563A764|nr:N-methyl-L-tryptophan oxidase [Pseudonocardia acaciae]
MIRPRVAVIGLGSVGSMALWRLAARGVEAVGYERFSPGHDRSAHGGESRLFRTAYLEDPGYVPLLRRARELWQRLEAESGASLLRLTGMLMIGSAGSDDMANVFSSVERYGVDAETVPLHEARARWPQHAFREDDVIVLDREAGYLRPELSVLHAATRARERGAIVHRYTTVTALDVRDDGVRVRTGSGSERFDHAVVTAGPWAAKVLAGLAPYVSVRRPVSAWFPARTPELFAPERFPPFIRSTPTDCYGVPALDGSGVKLGLSEKDNRPVDDPDSLDRHVPIDEVDAFRKVAADYFPDLFADPIRVSAYMEGYTPDGHGLVGPAEGSGRVTVVAGLSGHGFKLAPALGDIAADYAVDGTSAHTLDLLDPGRYPG